MFSIGVWWHWKVNNYCLFHNHIFGITLQYKYFKVMSKSNSKQFSLYDSGLVLSSFEQLTQWEGKQGVSPSPHQNALLFDFLHPWQPKGSVSCEHLKLSSGYLWHWKESWSKKTIEQQWPSTLSWAFMQGQPTGMQSWLLKMYLSSHSIFY